MTLQKTVRPTNIVVAELPVVVLQVSSFHSFKNLRKSNTAKSNVKLEFVLNLNLQNFRLCLNLKSSILLQPENARAERILVDEVATTVNEMAAAAVDTVAVAAVAEETRAAAVDTVAAAEEIQMVVVVTAAAVDTVVAAVAVAEEAQMAVVVTAAVAAVDIAVNREVRISNQARIQAKVTKVAKNHNRVAVIPVKKAATVVAAVTEIKFILLPEFDFLLG